MLIQNPQDLDAFMEMYDIKEIEAAEVVVCRSDGLAQAGNRKRNWRNC
jgi:hypothetical protein